MAKAKKTDKCVSMAPTILRVVVGLVLFIPGLMKLFSLISTGTHPVAGMLWGITAFAWILALVEVIAGGMVILGKKQCIASVLLMIVLVGAIGMTQAWSNPMNLLWHLLGIAALYQVLATSDSMCKKK